MQWQQKLLMMTASPVKPGLIATHAVPRPPARMRSTILDDSKEAAFPRTHYPHALAVAPIEFAAVLIEVDLFRRVRDALRDNDSAIPTIEVDPLD
jgi:hypothetical protein